MTLMVGIVRAVWRRKLAIVAVSALCGGFAALLAMETPRRYEAEATVLFRFGREYFPISPGEARRNWGENVNVTLDNALATEMRLMTGYDILAGTAAAFNGNIASPKGGIEALWARMRATPSTSSVEPTTHSDQIAALREILDIRRVPEATMIVVSLQHADHAMADDLLDAYLRVFLARRQEIFNRDAIAFFDSATAEVESERVVLLAALQELRAEAGGDPEQLTSSLADDELAELAGVIEREAAIRQRLEALTQEQRRLEAERTDWRLSYDYSRNVSPSAEIVDRTPAEFRSVGLSMEAKAISAAISGLLLAVFAVAAWHLISRTDWTLGEEDMRRRG